MVDASNFTISEIVGASYSPSILPATQRLSLSDVPTSCCSPVQKVPGGPQFQNRCGAGAADLPFVRTGVLPGRNERDFLAAIIRSPLGQLVEPFPLGVTFLRPLPGKTSAPGAAFP